MAVKFARANGVWSSGGTWDNGVVPVAGDIVYSNNYTVTLDQDISVDSLRNTTPTIYLPAMSIPLMTSNSTPSGTVIASTDIANAYKVFDQDVSTTWGPTANITGWVGYQFPSPIIIKRYYYNGNSVGYNSTVFQGSLDGSTWITLDTVPNATGLYTSGILTGTTGFTYYRLSIGGVQFGQAMSLKTLEMTENTGSTYGNIAGGTFTVPASLSGTRNITQSGAGIICSNGGTVVTIAATSGSTVNFNLSGSSSYIFNQYWNTFANTAGKGVSINGNCTVNFNGDIWGSQQNGAWTQGGEIFINANAIVNIYGNIYPDKGFGSGNDSYQIHLVAITSNSAILNITGNTVASNYERRQYNIFANSLATTNINGNLTSDIGTCYYSTAGSFLNIPNGTITVTNTNSNPAIVMSSASSLLTLKGPIINVGNTSAVLAQKFRFYSGQTAQWTFQDTTNANITLSSISSSGITIGLPLSGDVRYLTTYGQNNEYVGSLRVPSVDNVRKGVETDFTVGTADLTANDIFSAITTSSNSVAVRLRNVSTVQSAGDQIASLS